MLSGLILAHASLGTFLVVPRSELDWHKYDTGSDTDLVVTPVARTRPSFT